ncbi:winged-helix domain-containing protein, partial [Lachnoclostridium sp. MSJ-17]
MSKNDSISMSVIRRLPRYYRFLTELDEQGVDRISSNKLAEIMNVTASQVRQDLNCFGGFGQQGYGYSVGQLKDEIKGILGLNNGYKA